MTFLLVRIQPIQRIDYLRSDDFKSFNGEPLNFEISVLKGDPLRFKASKEYYLASDYFDKKVSEINKEFSVGYGGSVVAIDKYPYSQLALGAKKEEKRTGISRWEIECQSEHSDYDSIILLIPDLEPTVLSTLKFACNLLRGYSPSFIAFEQKVILSLTSPFGEVIGKSLPDHSETGLKFGNHHHWFYAMSFEKVSLPAVVLQKLLETKPQSESEPNEETHE